MSKPILQIFDASNYKNDDILKAIPYDYDAKKYVDIKIRNIIKSYDTGVYSSATNRVTRKE